MKLPTRALILLLALAATPALADEARSKVADFSLRTLSGERVKLSDHDGKVVIVNFWATWCAPCKQELPALQTLLDKYKAEGLEVLAVNIDDAKTVAEARRLVKDKNLSLIVPLDSESKVFGKLNPKQTLPYIAVIDRQGRRAFTHTGFNAEAVKALEEEVRALLAEKPATAAAP